LRSYLYRAVRNRALDILKHRAVERRWSEDAERDRCHSSTSHSVEMPDRVLELKTLIAEIERALVDVPERRRQVFLLRWKYGLSYAEVGSQLGITPKTVENHLNRVLHFLRERLAGERA
jgi:RNA polymerase sigma-70 factor (ECF subfamily)